MRPPTGEQFELTRSLGGHRSRAVITEVAAGLRMLEVDGEAIVDSFPEGIAAPFGAGTVLAPWPNRIRDGRWMLDGSVQQLDITEVGNNNALHGLLRTRPYRVEKRDADAVTLSATVYPQHGYPFTVDTSVRYELVDDGIAVTHEFANASDVAAPVAVGAHPFLRVGDTPIEDLVLTLAAGMHFVTDDRLNPTGQEPVEGTGYDLRPGAGRSGVRVGDLHLDDSFGGMLPGGDGVTRHRLTAPDGRYTELWQGPDFGFLQVFTTRRYPRAADANHEAASHEAGNHADGTGTSGLAVAIEPLTAPPDAFNSGLGVRWLAPGERWSASWGVSHGRR